VRKGSTANLRSKQQKSGNGQTVRDKLSANFMKAFESDFETHGVEVIEQLRQKSPEKYAEIAAKLIAASEPKADGFDDCNDMESIGRKLLRQVGVPEYDATAEMVQEALAAQDIFIAKLQAIRDEAQGPMQ
jgi:hypothetical protein